jgi:hypothetical protein
MPQPGTETRHPMFLSEETHPESWPRGKGACLGAPCRSSQCPVVGSPLPKGGFTPSSCHHREKTWLEGGID